MKRVNQISNPGKAIIGLASVFMMTLLFSCNKNIAEIPKQSAEELFAANISSHASTRTSLVAVPFENVVNVSCANDGKGEEIFLTGATNFVYQIRWNEQGFYLSYQSNDHNVTGTGLTTGDNFVASGGSHGTVMGSWVDGRFVSTTVQQLRITGQNINFTVTYKLHLAVSADGSVTVDKVEQSATCGN
jgi:hypothetical protein